MVTVSSAFISSRRERIIFRVLSASGCAIKAAVLVDVLRALLGALILGALGKTDLDNTDVARDHSFHCIANAESVAPANHTMHVGLTVSISSTPFPKFVVHRSTPDEPRNNGGLVISCFLVPPGHFVLQLPSWFRSPVDDRLSFMPVRKTQAGACWSASRPA